MNTHLVSHALRLLDKPLSDPMLRAALLHEGFGAEDVDLHLDHIQRIGLATVYAAPGHPPLWRLTLPGKEVLRGNSRSPIGFN